MKPQKTYRLRPCPGRRVRDPYSMKLLADTGEDKPRIAYWDRRLKDGDVEEMPASAPAAPKKPSKPADPPKSEAKPNKE